jgi:hypothetical protein
LLSMVVHIVGKVCVVMIRCWYLNSDNTLCSILLWMAYLYSLLCTEKLLPNLNAVQTVI